MYRIENPNETRQIYPVFVSHTELSKEAKRFADKLGISVYEDIDIGEIPYIKCHFGKDELGRQSKIYHLPVDLQYDKIVMKKKDGDIY